MATQPYQHPFAGLNGFDLQQAGQQYDMDRSRSNRSAALDALNGMSPSARGFAAYDVNRYYNDRDMRAQASPSWSGFWGALGAGEDAAADSGRSFRVNGLGRPHTRVSGLVPGEYDRSKPRFSSVELDDEETAQGRISDASLRGLAQLFGRM